MRVRQSDLKTWATCPLQYRYTRIDDMPRQQSGALTFGSLIHESVLLLETTGDLDGAVQHFRRVWADPTLMGAQYEIDYYNRGSSWAKYAAEGERILRDWWGITQWESDLVLGREYHFEVPIGDGHILEGTVDKFVLRHLPRTNTKALLVVDYKTNAKVPTYDYLAEDLQFTAYSYASTQEQFWVDIPGGQKLYEDLRSAPRYGEWVALKGPKRMDAGERTTAQYNRLIYAVNALADSVAMRIFVPNISGESCRYCPYRAQCGLAEIPA